MTDEEMLARHQERKEMTEAEKPKPAPRVKLGRRAGMPLDNMFSGRERDRICRACGQSFVQRELSSSVAKFVKSLPESAREYWAAVITENALPLFCVTCERREIGRAPIITRAPRSEAAA